MKIFDKSEKINYEYCGTIVRIGEITPIENSEFLGVTLIGDKTVVVRKDEVHTGDVMIYAQNETELDSDFLSMNNLYELSERDRNDNYKEVQEIIINYKNLLADAEKNPENKEEILKEANELLSLAKSKCGFFTKQSRVRMIKLRKQPSYGCLFSKETFKRYAPEVENVNLEEHIGEDFDLISGKRWIKVYVPKTFTKSWSGRSNKRDKNLKRFDRVIPGEFQYHYDTQQLGKNMEKISPDTKVTITVKMHGTSNIDSHVLCNKEIGVLKKIWNWISGIFFKGKKKFETTEYGFLYSSRSVIKNQFKNKKDSGYYGEDVWGVFAKILEPLLPQGMTIYSEIVGFTPESGKPIQKDYDYGCEAGQSCMYPYRIKTKDRKEWNLTEVIAWTENLIKEHPELGEMIKPIPLLYHGTLRDLYPEVDVKHNWQTEILTKLKSDKDFLGMERREPLCKNKVPREGIVIRIDDDPIEEAFKLKTDAFFEKEAKNIDNGEVDIEMEQNEN